MDHSPLLTHADSRLLDLVWQTQPIPSPALCRLAAERLGWKRTTTYTVIKRLCEKGYLQNQAAVVTALKGRDEARRAEGKQVLDKAFGGSLPQFVAAFLDGGEVSAEEAAEIARMLAEYRRRS